MEEEFRIYLKNDKKTIGTINTYSGKVECYKKWLKDSTGKDFKKLYRENIKDYICYLRTVKLSKKGLHLKGESINVHISALIKFNEFLIKTERQKEIVVSKDDNIAIQKNRFNPCKVTYQELLTFRQDVLEYQSRSLNNFETIRNFCMVTILLYCGLRISECISIETTDIEEALKTMELVIRNGKGEKQRTVYLNDKCISAIKRYKEVRPEDAGKYFFVTRESVGKDKIMDRTTVNKIFNKFSDVITPHQERHRLGDSSA